MLGKGSTQWGGKVDDLRRVPEEWEDSDNRFSRMGPTGSATSACSPMDPNHPPHHRPLPNM
eukprot:12930786-Prorocentrum_lima.AAC.1